MKPIDKLKCYVIDMPTEHSYLYRQKSPVHCLLFNCRETVSKTDNRLPLHLYFISNNELKEGDYFMWRSGNSGNKEIHQYHSDAGYGIKTYTNFNEDDGSSILVNHSGCMGKIEASTNPYFTVKTSKKNNKCFDALPLIPVTFIQDYVDIDGNIKEVEIKVYPEISDGWVPSYNNPDNNGFEQPSEPTGNFLIQTRDDNTVIIINDKKLYTQKEVIELCKNAHKAGYTYKTFQSLDVKDKKYDIDEWLEYYILFKR